MCPLGQGGGWAEVSVRVCDGLKHIVWSEKDVLGCCVHDSATHAAGRAAACLPACLPGLTWWSCASVYRPLSAPVRCLPANKQCVRAWVGGCVCRCRYVVLGDFQTAVAFLLASTPEKSAR